MTPRQKVVLGVFGVVMLGLLTTQLLVLEDSRRSIDRQEELAVAAAEGIEPVADEAQSLLRASGQLEQPLRRTRALLHRALRQAPEVAQATEVLPQVAEAVAELPRLVDAVVSEGRISAVLEGSANLLYHLSETGFVERATDSFQNVRSLLEEQRDLLAVQIAALGVLRDSLEIQQRTFKRVRRIDRRLGGVLPPPAP